MLLSIVIPVYYNEESLSLLYDDIKEKLIDTGYVDDYEIIMIDDGSGDNSFDVMKELRKKDDRVKTYKLSRNFGSHAAIMCGLTKASGDCIVVKAADMQEPTCIIKEMIEKWRKGANVVLAVRNSREEAFIKVALANMYYGIIRKFILPNMPSKGFDVYLLDKKVVDVLTKIDERNSVLTGLILWTGFKTDYIYYDRLAREYGKSRWTLRKKIDLFKNNIYSFSILPIKLISFVGAVSFIGALLWAIVVAILRIQGKIDVTGWTTMFIFNLLSFGIVMLTMGMMGQYIWRIYEDAKKRPTYIIEEDNEIEDSER